MKLLPNINKSVPEPTDPALIAPVSDALEAVDLALGAKPSTLATTVKTIVPAINELAARTATSANTPTFSAQSSYTVSPSHKNVVVKNGVCYVSIWITCNARETAYTQIATGLPRPDIERLVLTVPDGDAGRPLAVYVNAAQVLQVRYGDPGRTYMVELSYPVFEG